MNLSCLSMLSLDNDIKFLRKSKNCRGQFEEFVERMREEFFSNELEIQMMHSVIVEKGENIEKIIVLRECNVFAKLALYLEEMQNFPYCSLEKVTLEGIVEMAAINLNSDTLQKIELELIQTILQMAYQLSENRFNENASSHLSSLFLECLTLIYKKIPGEINEELYANILSNSKDNYEDFIQFLKTYMRRKHEEQVYEIINSLLKGFAKRLPLMMENFEKNSQLIRQGY